MADAREIAKTNPNKDSEFARGLEKQVAAGKLGVDPDTGERGNLSVRELYNQTGDMAKAERIFRDVARAGGFGDVDPRYEGGLDIRSLPKEKVNREELADRAFDKFERDQQLQAAQHFENLHEKVQEILHKEGIK